MEDDNLLDNKTIGDNDSVLNKSFKLFGLGALVFTSFLNLLYVFQYSLEYIGYKYGFYQYIVYFSSKILSIVLIGIFFQYSMTILRNKISSNPDIIDRMIRINLIFLIIAVLLNRFFVNIIFKMISNVHFDYGDLNAEESFNSFLEISEPIADATGTLILILLMLRLKRSINY